MDYRATRNRLSQDMIQITDRMASLEWDLEEVKDLHLRLSKTMTAEAEHLAALETDQPEGRGAALLLSA